MELHALARLAVTDLACGRMSYGRMSFGMSYVRDHRLLSCPEPHHENHGTKIVADTKRDERYGVPWR